MPADITRTTVEALLVNPEPIYRCVEAGRPYVSDSYVDKDSREHDFSNRTLCCSSIGSLRVPYGNSWPKLPADSHIPSQTPCIYVHYHTRDLLQEIFRHTKHRFNAIAPAHTLLIPWIPESHVKSGTACPRVSSVPRQQQTQRLIITKATEAARTAATWQAILSYRRCR